MQLHFNDMHALQVGFSMQINVFYQLKHCVTVNNKIHCYHRLQLLTEEIVKLDIMHVSRFAKLGVASLWHCI